MWNYPISVCFMLLQPGPLPSPTPQPQIQTSDTINFLWLSLGIGLGIGIGILLSIAFRKSRNKVEAEQPAITSLNIPQRHREGQRRKNVGHNVQRCPVCQSTYTDETLTYCVSDGASLVRVNDKSPANDPNATVLYPETGRKDLPPTEPYRPNRSSD